MAQRTVRSRPGLASLVIAALLLSAGAATTSAPPAAAAAATPFQTTVMSYNMLTTKANAGNWTKLTNSTVTQNHIREDLAWNRRVTVAASWLTSRPGDVIGLQENYDNDQGVKQVLDLLKLMPGFAVAQAGEETPILYRTSVYSKVSEGTFQTTFKGRKYGSATAAFDRYCSWVLLKNTATGRSMYAFNTHTEPYREEESAKVRAATYPVLIDGIKKLDPSFATPFVLTGDFNEKSTETKAPYNSMQSAFPAAGITDLAETSPNASAIAHVASYNGMGWELPPGDDDATWRYHAIRATDYRYDYVLASATVKGQSWEIVTGPGTRMLTADDGKRYPFFADGSIPSDHNPVREVVTVS